MHLFRKIMLWLVGSIAGIILLVFAIGCAFFDAPKYRGAPSAHFDGREFKNRVAVERGSGDLIKWMLNRNIGSWRDWVDTIPGPPPPERVEDLRVTFVNHSTVLIQFRGINILTDPVWSERVGPANMFGPLRRRRPGIRLVDLPPIDAVLISHNHYDHLDLPTLRTIARLHRPRIYLPLGNKALLDREEIVGGMDLDWWQSNTLAEGFRITCVPAEHFSGRGISDRNKTLWGGFVISANNENLYFAGDTGWGPHFDEIRERFSPIRLAMLPIGAYRPRWFMAPIHIDPQDAVRAHTTLAASTSLAIHFGTFLQADDGEFEPIVELEKWIATVAEPKPRFWVLRHGEGREVPAR